MQEKFDQELIQRFRAVFGQYEDASADEGWKKLLERFPEPKKDRAVIRYLLTLAASVIVLAFAWSLFNLKYDRHFQTSRSVYLSVLPHTKEPRASKYEKSTSKFEKNKKTGRTARLIPNQSQIPGSSIRRANSGPKLVTHAETESGLSGAKLAIRQRGRANSGPKIMTHAETDKASGAETYNSVSGERISPDQTADENINKGQPNSIPLFTRITVNQLPVSDKHSQTLFILTTALNEKEPSLQITWNQLPDIGHNFSKRNRRKQKISLVAYTGSYLGYARGSDHHANIGGGIGGNIPLFGRLSLSTGLGLAPNNLYFAAGQTPTAAMTGYMVAGKSNVLSVSRSVNTEPQTNYSGYNARLVGLDIPLNLQYMFDLGPKTQLYVSTGVSSDLFLHETYTYHYTGTDANSQLKAYDINQNGNAASHAGSNLNLARLINLAVGISYPVGKQSSLSVEPFLKYPLKGIGSQQLHLGYGGINLKMSFSNRKKKP